MSIQNNVPSEYTFMEMILVKKNDVKKEPEPFLLQKVDLYLGVQIYNNNGIFYYPSVKYQSSSIIFPFCTIHPPVTIISKNQHFRFIH